MVNVTDVRPMPITTHLISLSRGDQGEGLIRWSTRELHTYRKTVCGSEFSVVDRRCYATIDGMLRDNTILEQLSKCDACAVLLQFALANSYFLDRSFNDASMLCVEYRFEWRVPGSFEWLREELEAK